MAPYMSSWMLKESDRCLFLQHGVEVGPVMYNGTGIFFMLHVVNF